MPMEFGFFMRGQFPAEIDMQETFAEACEQARVADELGYSYILKGQHYSTAPMQALQLVPFLSRIMVEAPNAKLVTGIVLLPLHKPLDIAEQLASIDIMSGGRLVFGSGIGYRDVEFKAFGTEAKDRGKRFEECLEGGRVVVNVQVQVHHDQSGPLSLGVYLLLQVAPHLAHLA